MKRFTLTLCLIVFIAFLFSCSEDDANDDSVVGTWELTTWTIEIPIDLNSDTLTSTNLLDEAICDNNERLIFDANGTVSSNATYNPQITVSLIDGTTDVYIFNVVCDMEGIIGTAGEYSQNNNSVTLFDKTAVITGNQLTIVYEDAIDIYNEELTEVMITKNLTLVYTKK